MVIFERKQRQPMRLIYREKLTLVVLAVRLNFIPSFVSFGFPALDNQRESVEVQGPTPGDEVLARMCGLIQ